MYGGNREIKSERKGIGTVASLVVTFLEVGELEVLVSTVLPAGSSEVNTVRQGEIFREAC